MDEPDRSCQQRLHQAVEAREGVRVTAEKAGAGQNPRQRFFRLYENLCELRGTTIGCQPELSAVYQRGVSEISLCTPSAHSVLPHRWFTSRTAGHEAIVRSVAEIHNTDRPVLVGTRSIEDSELITAAMTDYGLSVSVQNGMQTAEEADIVAASRSPQIWLVAERTSRQMTT